MTARTASVDPDSIERAMRLIQTTENVCDMTLPLIEDYWSLDTLRRFKAAGYSFVSVTIEDFPATFDGVRYYISRLHDIVAEQEWLAIVDDQAGLDLARQQGNLALGIHVQDCAPIETDLSRVAALHALGVRHMLLAYNIRNYIADGCAEASDAGLSNFGRQVVREMNRVGIMIDGSHTGRRSSLEAIELSDRPTIFSHSGAYSVSPHIRNLTDEQIRACAAGGGVIGLVGNGSCLGDADARPETLFRHIDHVASLVGIEHVGLGLDFLANKPAKKNLELSRAIGERMRAKRTAWPDLSVVWPDPTGTQIPLEDSGTVQPEQLAELVAILLDHGYDENGVRGILGENFLRVYAGVL